jgi:hypothetical protein
MSAFGFTHAVETFVANGPLTLARVPVTDKDAEDHPWQFKVEELKS